MAKEAQAWRRNNPHREVLVQFNFPKTIMFISTVNAARARNAISVNDAGNDLISEICDPNEASVMMLRIALDLPIKNDPSN